MSLSWDWWIAWVYDHGWVSALIVFTTEALFPLRLQRGPAPPFLGSCRWFPGTSAGAPVDLVGLFSTFFQLCWLSFYFMSKDAVLILFCITNLFNSSGLLLNWICTFSFPVGSPTEVMAAWKEVSARTGTDYYRIADETPWRGGCRGKRGTQIYLS